MTLTDELFDDIREDVINRIDSIVSHGAVGTDDTEPDSTDTFLGNETFRKAVEDTEIGSDNIIIPLEILTGEANGDTLVEMGLFDSDSGGTLWERDLFDETLKTSDINLFLDTKINVEVFEDE